MRYHIGSIQDFPVDSMVTVSVAGKSIALVRLSDGFFATDDTCTHEECSLGTEGFLEGERIICGCHGAAFNPRDGHVLSLPATTDLATYRIDVTGDDVYITV